MQILRYIILVLFVCNVSSIVLINYGDSAGSLLSYSSFILLIVYYFLSSKSRPAWPFIIFAITYFVISGLIGVESEKDYFIDFIKYLLIIVCGGQLIYNTKINELTLILAIGVSTILLNVIFFSSDYGRYSGFYVNANEAGFAALIGFVLCFGLTNQKWKLIGQAFFTFCGILTFSRTFLLLWSLLIIVSIFQNKKNFKILAIGIGTLILFFSVNELLKLNSERFNTLSNLVNSGQVDTFINKGSRTETWSQYYNLILNSPISGNGYRTFTSDQIYEDGVHNNYLRVIGESGIIPFLLYLGIYFFMLYKSFAFFKSKGHLVLLAITLIGLNLTTHNFDTVYFVILISIWLFFKVTKHRNKPLEINDEKKIK
jgi:O-antigen ligase